MTDTVPATGAAPVDGFPYALVATDLDGTLLRTDHSVSPRAREALAEVVRRGATHVVVTGRGAAVTEPVLRELGYEGLAVCGQGAQLYHAGERRLLTSLTLDRGVARAALTRVQEELGTLMVSASRDGLAGEVVQEPDFRTLGPLAVRVVPREELLDEPVTKLYVQHPRLSDEVLAKSCQKLVGDLVTVVLSGPDIVELLPLGLTKASGMSLVTRRLGLRGARSIAFGDMPNDVPLLGWASHGVAMGGAHQELLSVADEVTATNDEDGVALVLERLLSEA
ncbi:HAD family hydrolase [Streptomyces sp. NPDC005438]|uniref:HAD family hydrolase n=1 Tax=Streptomyces sp. NPDC005438 TaxID=3156880 RepID=UPI0033AEFD02